MEPETVFALILLAVPLFIQWPEIRRWAVLGVSVVIFAFLAGTVTEKTPDWHVLAGVGFMVYAGIRLVVYYAIRASQGRQDPSPPTPEEQAAAQAAQIEADREIQRLANLTLIMRGTKK